MEQWSSAKIWWLDLLKSALTFIVAAFFSVGYLDRLEDENARQQFRWRKDYEINIRILDELKKSSFLYQEAALDAYWATLQGDLKSPSILHWQTEAYNSMRLSLENVKSRFSAELFTP